MMLFFLLQPLLITGQAWMRTALLPPHWLGSTAPLWLLAAEVVCSVMLILASAELLFWEPLEACRVDERGLAEMRGWVSLALGASTKVF